MPNTLFVGKVYYRFDELPSTNDWAANLVAQPHLDSVFAAEQSTIAKIKPPEGTVVRAANQTAGRGQLGSRWQSSAGKNLLLSVIFYPNWLETPAQFYLSMAVALGLNDVVKVLGESSSLGHAIKWPNDIYLDEKKVAGVLIQNALTGSKLQSSIVGIGLNVNQLEFPDDLPNATSLALSLGETLDLEEVSERLFECLEHRYLQLKSGNKAAIKTEYETQLWRRGVNSQFIRTADGSAFEGVILGVTAQGLLQVECGSTVEEFEIKQLKFVV